MEPGARETIDVAVIDDDGAVVKSLTAVLQSKGFHVHSFADANGLSEYLFSGLALDCIIADVPVAAVPDLTHPSQAHDRRPPSPPVILTSKIADIDAAIRAIKAGAHDFIVKPIDTPRLVASVEAAARNAREKEAEFRQSQLLETRLAALRDRHREVLDLAVAGLTSKQIAARLGISPRTVEKYRAAVMEHVGVGNIAQLVRLCLSLRNPGENGGTPGP